MTKVTFKPQLIGKNQDAINEKMDHWEYATKILNDLATLWKSVFNENFSIQFLNEILRTKPGLIEKYLKTHYINLDPEYAKFTGKFKMDIALSITQFPDFMGLPDLIKNVIKRHFDQHISEVEYDQWIHNFFVDGKFVIPEEIRAFLEKQNTFYTTNLRENLVLELVKKLGETLNILNDIGAGISSKDLPKPLVDCFDLRRTGKRHDTLELHYSQENYGIMHLIPSHNLKSNRNSIYSLVLNNLSDEEVAEMYEKLTPNHKNLHQ
jgi:hypothetical protein